MDTDVHCFSVLISFTNSGSSDDFVISLIPTPGKIHLFFLRLCAKNIIPPVTQFQIYKDRQNNILTAIGYEAISALFPFFCYDKTVLCRHYDSVDLCWIVRFILHYAQLYPYIVHVILCIYHNITPGFAKTSGKHMANRTATFDGSFFTIFTSPPI